MTKFIPRLWFLSLLVYPGFSTAQDSYWLGDTRGPWKTGTYSDMWVDTSRDEPTTLGTGEKRRVMVQFWYPTDADADGVYAPYISNAEWYQDYVQEWGQQFGSTPTLSVLDAAVHADGPFPVLLYSHGGNSPLFTGTAQTEFLASHGYIVVSVAHTDDSAIVQFPDGTAYQPIAIQQLPAEQERAGWSQLEIYRWQKEHLQEMHSWHVDDLSFALDMLEKWNRAPDNMFYRRLDMNRAAAFGWSRGGATSFQATVDDPRVKAAANLDGTVYGRSIEIYGSDSPLLLLEGTNSYFDPLHDKQADPELEELWASVEMDLWGMFRRSTSDWYRAKIVGTTHTQFSDFPLANASPPEEFIKPQRVRDITNAVLLEFFDKHLKGRGDTPLLSGQNIYPELRTVTAKTDQ